MVGLRIPGRPTGPDRKFVPRHNPTDASNINGEAVCDQLTVSYRLLPRSGRSLGGKCAQYRLRVQGCRKCSSAAGLPAPDRRAAVAPCRNATKALRFGHFVTIVRTPGSSLGGRPGHMCRSGTAQYRVSAPAGAGRPGFRVDPAHPVLCTGGACRPCWSRPCGAGRLAYSDTGLGSRFGRTRHHRTARAGAPFAAQAAPSAAPAQVLFLLGLLAPAKADRGEPLQQRLAPPRMLLLGQLAAPGANLILRRHRQLVEPRHAGRARCRPLRLRRNELAGFERFFAARRRLQKQRRIERERTDIDLLGRRGRWPPWPPIRSRR